MLESRLLSPASSAVKHFARNHWPVLLAYVPLAVILRAWFAPGLIVGEDWHAPSFISFAQLDHAAFWPQAFDTTTGLGQDVQAWLTGYPIWAAVGLFHRLGIGWPLLERLFWLWPLFLLLVAAPYTFFLRRNVAPAAAAIGASVFAINTWTIGLIERGHIPALVAYALIPLAVDAFLGIVRRRDRHAIASFVAVILIEAAFEVRYAYLTLLTCMLLYVGLAVQDRRRFISKEVAIAVATALVAVAIGSVYWVIPQILNPIYLPQLLTTDALKAASGELTVLNAFGLFYPYYHHNQIISAFFASPFEAAFLALPVAAIAGYIATFRRPLSKASVFFGVFFIVVASGPNSIFAPVVYFVFQHVPGFAAFRDLTKLFSVIAFVEAFGIALCANHVCALLRHTRRSQLFAAFAFCAVGLIVVLMHDAFNPLRASNFAVTTLRPEDKSVQRFIEQVPGMNRIVMFPTIPSIFSGTPAHPVIAGEDLALNETDGFAAFIPSKNQSVFSFYRSGVAPQLLKEIGAAYLIVIDDPTHEAYKPEVFGISHDEAVQYFDRVPYLARVTSIGRYVVYRTTFATTLRPAFYAACPSLYLADATATAPLWPSRFMAVDPGLVLAQQQSPSADLSLVPNRIVGRMNPSRFDPMSLANLGTPSAADRKLWQLRDAMTAARYVESQFAGDISAPVAAESDQSFIKETWRSRAGERWRLQAAISTRRASRAVVLHKRFQRILRIPIDMYSPMLAPSSIDARLSLDGGSQNTTGHEGMLVVTNPFEWPVNADVIVQGVQSTSYFPETVSIRSESRSSSVSAPPRFAGFARDLALHDVVFAPGVNRFDVRIDDGAGNHDFAVRGDVIVRNVRFSTSSLTPQPLPLRQTASAAGVAIAPLRSAALPAAATARLRVASMLSVSLSRDPMVLLHYTRTVTAGAAYLALGFEFGDGEHRELRVPIPLTATTLDLRLATLLAAAYNSIWNEEILSHEGDVMWQQQNLASPPDWSGASLRYIDVVVLKPPGLELAGGEALRLSSLSISTGRTAAYDGPRVKVVDAANLHTAQVVPGEPSSFAIKGMTRAPSRLTLNVHYQGATTALPPTMIRRGDSVRLTLTSGHVISGIVVSETSGLVQLQVQGARVGVMRSAIATIDNVAPTDFRPLVLNIPVSINGSDQRINFLLKMSPWLRNTLRLGVRVSSSSAVAFIAPTDRTDLTDVDPSIPSDWASSVPVQADSPFRAIGVVESLDAGYGADSTWQKISLNLSEIYKTQIPEVENPRLRVLEIEVEPTDESATQLDGEVQIADIQAVASAENESDPADSPGVRVDGRGLKWRATDRIGDEQYFDATTPPLPAGLHAIETFGVKGADVDGVLLSRGTPACLHSSAQFFSLNESEIIGTSAAGLVVQNASYNPNWHLAIMPPGTKLSGNIISDLLRAFPYIVPESAHYVVNGTLNGWWLPQKSGVVALLFMPTASSYVGAFAELFALIGLLWFFGRR